MTIIRDSGPIKQSFFIDPTLSVPSELLPALTLSEQEAGGTRNNLNLEAKYGEIDADIEVMKSTKLTRIRVDVRSRSDVVIRLVCLFHCSKLIRKLTSFSVYLALSLREI